jgi:hypothetical protein
MKPHIKTAKHYMRIIIFEREGLRWAKKDWI